MSKKEETTNVAQIDIDLNDLLGTGVDTVMVANEAKGSSETKKSIFSRNTPDTAFLDNPVEETGTEEKITDSAVATEETSEKDEEVLDTPKATTNDDITDALSFEAEETQEEKHKGGRPTALVSATKKLMEKGLLTPFVDRKSV